MSSYVSSVSYHLPALESSFVKSLGGITALSLSVIACTALSCRVSFVSVLNIDARPLFAFALGTSLVAGLFFARCARKIEEPKPPQKKAIRSPILPNERTPKEFKLFWLMEALNKGECEVKVVRFGKSYRVVVGEEEYNFNYEAGYMRFDALPSFRFTLDESGAYSTTLWEKRYELPVIKAPADTDSIDLLTLVMSMKYQPDIQKKDNHYRVSTSSSDFILRVHEDGTASFDHLPTWKFTPNGNGEFKIKINTKEYTVNLP